MWRIFNKLFGWHYAQVESTCMGYMYILRVRKSKNGDLYGSFVGECWFLEPSGKTHNGYKWTPLTWSIKQDD